jgi:cytochrome c peroxidase
MNYKTALVIVPVSALLIAAGIDLANLDNYSAQAVPAYITKDNCGPNNPVTNKGATLGRVLFYDKQLSVNNAISCASCHKQQFAFSDTAQQSLGVTGTPTTRHAMRLVNARFANEVRFFWDERATSLEDQTSRPIQDHNEMGYSGQLGDPDINALINKLSQLSYYNTLFTFVYGNATITEARIQDALSQFIRSIQSFDSKFDIGLAQAGNLNAPFANYTALENQGKALFLAPPPQGGAGCQGCHRAPEFDIDPNSKNNGVIGVAGSPNAIDLTNTRAPSLRDLFNPNGVLNGRLMHNGNFTTIDQVLAHYSQVPQNPANTNLDPRLAGPGGQLQLTAAQRSALSAFLKTLSGNNLYTDPKWSDPFDANGNLNGNLLGIKNYETVSFSLYPNPVSDYLQVNIAPGHYQLRMMDLNGRLIMSRELSGPETISLTEQGKGAYLLEIKDMNMGGASVKKMIKN